MDSLREKSTKCEFVFVKTEGGAEAGDIFLLLLRKGQKKKMRSA